MDGFLEKGGVPAELGRAFGGVTHEYGGMDRNVLEIRNRTKQDIRVVRDEVVELFSEFTREESHAILISSHVVCDLERL